MTIRDATRVGTGTVRLGLVATALTLLLAALGAGPAAANAVSRSAARSGATTLPGPEALIQLGAGYGPTGSGPVRELQRRLAQAGYSLGRPDGRYGVLTADAVTRYQADHGLRVDGIAGPETQAALSAHRVVLRTGAGYQLGGSPAVRHLQRLLARARYSPGPVDGLFGPRTEAALRGFQAHHGLHANGVAAASTLAALRSPSSRTGPVSSRPSRGPSHRPVRPPAPPSAVPGAPQATAPASPSQRAPAPASRPRRVNHPTSGTPALWLWLLGLVLIGLLVGAPLYVRHTRRDETGDTTGISPDGPGVFTPNGNGAVRETHPPVSVPEPAEAADVPEPVGTLDPAALFDHGVALQGRRDRAGAEAAYRRADEQGHPASASNLGVLLEERGELTAAEAAYRRADERGESNGAFNLGVLLEEREDLAGAESAYRRADERGHPAAASNLGVLLEGQDDRDGAEAAYRRAVERDEPNGAFNLGVLLEERKDFAGAEAAYRRAEQAADPRVSRLARAALLDLIPGIADAAASRSAATDDA